MQAGDLAVLRSAIGLPPSLQSKLQGLVLARDIRAGAPLVFADLPTIALEPAQFEQAPDSERWNNREVA